MSYNDNSLTWAPRKAASVTPPHYQHYGREQLADELGGFGGRGFRRLPRAFVLTCLPCRHAVCETALCSVNYQGGRVARDDKCDIIFPIPSLRKANDAPANSNPLSMQFQGMAARAFEINADEPLPLPLTIRLGETTLSQEVKEQIQAQILATLVVDLAEENPDNLEDIAEQLATAVDSLERGDNIKDE